VERSLILEVIIIFDNFGELFFASPKAKKPKHFKILTVFLLIFSVPGFLLGIFIIIAVGITNGVIEAIPAGISVALICLFLPLLPKILLKLINRNLAYINLYECGIEIYKDEESNNHVRYSFEEIDWIQYSYNPMQRVIYFTIKPKLSNELFFNGLPFAGGQLLAGFDQFIQIAWQVHAKYLLRSAKSGDYSTLHINFSNSDALSFYIRDNKVVFSSRDKTIEIAIKELLEVRIFGGSRFESGMFIVYYEDNKIPASFSIRHDKCVNMHVLSYLASVISGNEEVK